MENQINYLEFKTTNIKEIKEFYSKCFNWSFKDYGSNYTTFAKSGISGGFELTESEITNGLLAVLYHSNLDEIKKKILKSGGKISKEDFPFPGGKRFHFLDPSGNELGVWSDK